MVVKRINSGGNHRYVIDGIRVPGVTTVLSLLGKDLIRWAASTVADYVIDNPHTVLGMSKEPDAAREFMRNLPISHRNKAAARGSQIHVLGEQIANGEEVDVPDESLPYVLSYVEFLNRYRPFFRHTEIGVASRENMHGGTADGIVEFPDDLVLVTGEPHPLAGLTAMVDLKTGRGLWEEMVLQQCAYLHSDTMVVDGKETNMPEIDVCLLVHIGEFDVKVVPITTGPLQYRGFLSLLKAYNDLRAAGLTVNHYKIKGTPDLLLEPYPDPWTEEDQ